MSDISDVCTRCANVANVKPEQMDMMRKQTAMCFTSRASSCCGLNRFDWKTIFSFVCLFVCCHCQCRSVFVFGRFCLSQYSVSPRRRDTGWLRGIQWSWFVCFCLFCLTLVQCGIVIVIGPRFYCYCYWSKVLLC